MDKIWFSVTLPPAAGVSQEKKEAHAEQAKPAEPSPVQATLVIPLAVREESPQCCPPGCCG